MGGYIKFMEKHSMSILLILTSHAYGATAALYLHAHTAPPQRLNQKPIHTALTLEESLLQRVEAQRPIGMKIVERIARMIQPLIPKATVPPLGTTMPSAALVTLWVKEQERIGIPPEHMLPIYVKDEIIMDGKTAWAQVQPEYCLLMTCHAINPDHPRTILTLRHEAAHITNTDHVVIFLLRPIETAATLLSNTLAASSINDWIKTWHRATEMRADFRVLTETDCPSCLHELYNTSSPIYSVNDEFDPDG